MCVAVSKKNDSLGGRNGGRNGGRIWALFGYLLGCPEDGKGDDQSEVLSLTLRISGGPKWHRGGSSAPRRAHFAAEMGSDPTPDPASDPASVFFAIFTSFF